MAAGFEVPIIIVGFGHSDDIVKCLRAVAIQRRCPKFEVFICENGGPAAYDALIETLTEKGAPCDGGVEPLDPASNEFVRACMSATARRGGSGCDDRRSARQWRLRRGDQRLGQAIARRPRLDRGLDSQSGHLA
jgi:hypothetical protein